MRKRGDWKRAIGIRAPMLIPLAPNDRCSLDFVSDQLPDGRRFRILTVVDDCTREFLALVADTSLSGQRVARELDRIIERRGKPKIIVSDIGSEFTSNAILQWTDRSKVEWHYIAPAKPIQNAFIGCFMYRRLRGRKRLSASSGHDSGAIMCSAFNCDRYNGRWALTEDADRGLINGSRLNGA